MITGSPSTLRIYLIRHGETDWSLSGRHTGTTDLALTVRGEESARDLRNRFQNIAFSQVLTSPRKRARQTCELAGLAAHSEIVPDLAEWDYGDYEGLTAARISELSPGWIIFRDGCSHGEMPADVCQRADRLIERLRGMQGNVALFSHGHFGRALAVRWIGSPMMTAQHFLLGTASVSVLCFNHGLLDQPAIDQWNTSSREIFL